MTESDGNLLFSLFDDFYLTYDLVFSYPKNYTFIYLNQKKCIFCKAKLAAH